MVAIINMCSRALEAALRHKCLNTCNNNLVHFLQNKQHHVRPIRSQGYESTKIIILSHSKVMAIYTKNVKL